MRRTLAPMLLLLASPALAAGLDARDYDVRADGTTDDLPALKAACAAASKANRRLDLPAGKIRCVVPVADQGYGIMVYGPLDLHGEGRDSTTLAVEPSTDRGNLSLFMVPDNAAGYGVTFSGLSATCAGIPDPSENRMLIWHRGPRVDGARSWLRVRDVATSGGWTTAFFMDAGTQVNGSRVDWDFDGCNLGATYNCLFFYGAPIKSRYLRARGCTFESGTPDGRGNCLYISQSCSILVDGCLFRNNSRAALKYAGVNAVGSGDYGIVSNCAFVDCKGVGIETDKFLVTQIEGCTFGPEIDRAIVHFGGVAVSGCVSYGRAFLSPSGASAKDALITVRDCRLVGCTQVMAGAATTDWTGTVWRFSGLDIKGGSLSTGSLFLTRAPDERVEIADCRIDAVDLQSAIVGNLSTWELRGTSIKGMYVRGVVEVTAAPKMIDVRNCEIAPAGGKAAFWISATNGIPPNTIRGRGCRTSCPLSEIRALAVPVGPQDWRDDAGAVVPFP
jgi:hypothetical protein